MGYEIRYLYHPRKEEGGYDTDSKEEKTIKVGKPFDDTPLEKCAAAIMVQLARRDVWVVDVQVYELVKKEISFKESTDGKSIILKNKKYGLGSTAEVLAEDLVEVQEPAPMIIQQNQMIHQGMQPHEMIAQRQQDLSNLYDSNAAVPIKKTPRPPVNQNRVLYFVYYEPYMYQVEAQRLRLKFSEDRKYPVHEVIPSVTGKLDAQQIAVTDDTGKVMILDEKFFTSAGKGLLADDELGFSGSSGGDRVPKRKLMYEDSSYVGKHPDEQSPQAAPAYKKVNRPANRDIPANIPLDDGSIPEELFAVPDLRPGRKV